MGKSALTFGSKESQFAFPDLMEGDKRDKGRGGAAHYRLL